MVGQRRKEILDDEDMGDVEDIGVVMVDSQTRADTPISDTEWRLVEHEVARYIAAMTKELGAMARSAKMDLLVYFLEMANTESTAQMKRTAP